MIKQESSREEILARIGLFENITEPNLRALGEICLEKDIAKGRLLFREGDKGYSLYILVTGSVQLYKTAPDGREVVIKVVRSGEMFGEVILFEQDCYPVSAVALRNSRLYAIPKHQFSCLLEREDFRRDFMASLMRKMRYLADKIQYLTAHDVEDRLFLFLEEQFGRSAGFVCHLSKKQVAVAIGTTPETLSRLLLRLKREGKLSWEGKRIEIAAEAWPG
ncbi:MAG: cyclic nucleotide-binding domain-containing protein [Chitinivibrionales bacterium]|nr:cyclic nucleotide-binding domain-containing protein [Chitinivibrionales bacterium]MBD3357279.1 cyclic nucleotide-binding domain-containing protein [Chitinivibrionales bacterium]